MIIRGKMLARKCIIKLAIRLKTNGGFGLNEFLGIAAAVIMAGLVIIPGLTELSGEMLDRLGTWWGTMANQIFITDI